MPALRHFLQGRQEDPEEFLRNLIHSVTFTSAPRIRQPDPSQPPPAPLTQFAAAFTDLLPHLASFPDSHFLALEVYERGCQAGCPLIRNIQPQSLLAIPLPFTLHLPIHLADVFAAFVEDVPDGSCDCGAHYDATRCSTTLAEGPAVLFLYLKRSAFDQRSLKGYKDARPVDLPETIHPEEFKTLLHPASPDFPNPPSYSLRGFGRHLGKEMSHGHYDCFVKVNRTALGCSYIHCDDYQVLPVSSAPIQDGLLYCYSRDP